MAAPQGPQRFAISPDAEEEINDESVDENDPNDSNTKPQIAKADRYAIPLFTSGDNPCCPLVDLRFPEDFLGARFLLFAPDFVFLVATLSPSLSDRLLYPTNPLLTRHPIS